MISVCSLDPGVTTGYCFGYIDSDLETYGALYFFSDQEKWSEYELYNALLDYKPMMVVCETFDFRKNQREGLDLTPAHLIGIVNLYIQVNPKSRVFFQNAATGKAGYFGDNNKLKEYEIYNRGKPHSNDATRHLMQWAMFGAGHRYMKSEKWWTLTNPADVNEMCSFVR